MFPPPGEHHARLAAPPVHRFQVRKEQSLREALPERGNDVLCALELDQGRAHLDDGDARGDRGIRRHETLRQVVGVHRELEGVPLPHPLEDLCRRRVVERQIR
jgi:hypothetical protein